MARTTAAVALILSVRRPLVLLWLAGGMLATASTWVRAQDWPQWLGAARDAVWREEGVLREWPAADPPVRWRTPLNAGYSGPAVADGRLFITDRIAEVDSEGKPVKDGDRGLKGVERVLCLDAAEGRLLWKREYDCPYAISYGAGGPRTTPLVDGSRVYCLGAMGDVLCLRVEDGEVVWRKNLLTSYSTKPPFWGYAAHPLLDGDRLILLAGGPGSAVVALDKNTGEEIWKALEAEEVGYAPPVLHEVDGRRQLIVWLDTAVQAVDPATGRALWSTPFPVESRPQRPAVTIMTPLVHQGRLLVSNFYNGAANWSLASDGPQLQWKSLEKDDGQYKQGLNVLMATPMIIDDHVYGVGHTSSGRGYLRCVDWKTGEQLWEDASATGDRPEEFATVFIVRHEERCWIFNDQGQLILCRLTPEGYSELGRMKVLEPVAFARGRNVVWSHPAFANGCMYARNDQEMVCVDLRAR